MSEGLVSIITPVFNAEKFIRATIESVMAQTYENWEHILVIDQNSKDQSEEIVEEFCQKDPRIKIVTSPLALGAANNRNLGLQRARGEFIAFIDSDDIWFPEKLQKQIQFMQQGQINFSYHTYVRMSEDGTQYGHALKTPAVLDYFDLLRDNLIGCLTVMLRRSAFEKIEFQNEGWEDMALWLSLLRDGSKTYGLQEPLAFYRVVEGSRSNNKLFAAGLRWDTYRKVEKMSVPKSTYYFLQYAMNSMVKYARF